MTAVMHTTIMLAMNVSAAITFAGELKYSDDRLRISAVRPATTYTLWMRMAAARDT